MAINPKKAISIAATFSDSCRPSLAPAAAASIAFLDVFSMVAFTVPLVSGWPVSGTRIFASSRAAGAAIKLAPSRCSANRNRAASKSKPCTSANGPLRKAI